MVIFQAVILGIIQGLTEYIPVSSSAHLIIVPWLFGWSDPVLTSLSFDVALHLGTLIAVIWFFFGDWLRLIKAAWLSIKERSFAGDNDRKLAWLLVIACIPGGLAGVLGESKIDALFHQPNTPILPSAMLVMAGIIVLLAAALFIFDRVSSHFRDLKEITLKDAVIIGFAQAFAIFPGVSRSGATITAGLGVGLKRESAARFSFLLSAPIIAGAGLKSAWDLFHVSSGFGAFTSLEWLLFPIGLVTAAISGYFCIRFLLRYLQNHSMDVFVIYRFALAALIVVVVLIRG